MKAERATEADIDGLVRARLAYLAEDFGGMPGEDGASLSARLPGYFLGHLGRDLFCYVIRENGAIAACAFLLVVEKPMSPAFPNGRTGMVLNVYTEPRYRRRGYAKTLLEALLADARALELSTVELKSTDAGYHLYRSAGFADDSSHYRHMKWTTDR